MFIMASVCAGAGYGSVFRFPYMCHLHGGSPFFIGYALALLFIGWPTLVLELCLGQHLQAGCLKSLTKVHPCLKGLGVACIAIGSCAITAYFAVVLSWSERYIVGSTQDPIPWAGNASTALEFFRISVVAESKDAKTTAFNWTIFVGLTILYTAVCISVWRGINTLQYALHVTFLPICFFLLCLTVVAVILPGSENGLKELFAPRAEFFSLRLWTDALGQAFLSLAVGSGTMVTHGSHNAINHNIVKYSMIIVVVQVFIALCCGICTYSVLGSTVIDAPHRSATKAISHGMHLPFIVYPLILAHLPIPQFFSFIFFLWLFILGVGAVAAPVHSLHATLRDKFTHVPPFVLSAVISVFCVVLGLPFCFGSGYYLVLTVDLVVVGICLPLHVFFECVGVGYIWGDRSVVEEVRERGNKGLKKFRDYIVLGYQHGVAHIRELLGSVEKLNVDPYIFPALVKVVVPVTSVITGFRSIFALGQLFFDDAFPTWTLAVAIFLPCASLVLIMIFWVTAPSRAVQKPPWSNDMLNVEMQFSKDNIVAVTT